MLKRAWCALWGHKYGFWYFDEDGPPMVRFLVEKWHESDDCQRCGKRRCRR